MNKLAELVSRAPEGTMQILDAKLSAGNGDQAQDGRGGGVALQHDGAQPGAARGRQRDAVGQDNLDSISDQSGAAGRVSGGSGDRSRKTWVFAATF